jgi:hypothetical protein
MWCSVLETTSQKYLIYHILFAESLLEGDPWQKRTKLTLVPCHFKIEPLRHTAAPWRAPSRRPNQNRLSNAS